MTATDIALAQHYQLTPLLEIGDYQDDRGFERRLTLSDRQFRAVSEAPGCALMPQFSRGSADVESLIRARVILPVAGSSFCNGLTR